MAPALLEEFCTEYTRHLNALRNEKNASLIAAKAELTRLAKERLNLIQAIKDGVPASEVKDDLARITARHGAKSWKSSLMAQRKSRCSCIPIWRAIIANRSQDLPLH